MEPSPPVDLAQEQRRILRNSAFGLLFCSLILTAAHWSIPRQFRMPGEDLASLLTFWAGCALLTVLWVFVGFAIVARGRRHSPDDIGGSAFAPPSPRIAIPVAFLQNTVEQSFMAVIVQIAVLLLAGGQMAALVAGQVFLFAIGRITFLAGYPKGAGGRAFGLAVTALPTLAGLVVALGALVSALLARLM